MINLPDLSIVDILPESVKSDERALNAAKAIDARLKEVSALAKQATFINRIDELPSQMVDELAYQFHVDFYDPTYDLKTRRELVKNAIKWHKRKGTKSAVSELVNALFGDGEVLEWFDYGGAPGMFKVRTSNSDVTGSLAQDFIAAVNSVKNTRSHLEAVELSETETLQMFFGFAIQTGEKYTIKQTG